MAEDASRDSSVLDGKGKMRRAGVFWVCAFMLLNGLVFVQFATPSFGAETLYVGGAGSGNYTRIQDAIDNATAGDTVYVYAGYYPEDLDFGKTLSLIGMPGTRLDSIRIQGSDYVNVTGFEMDSMFMGVGISHNARITNNTITSGGLYMVMSQDVTIQGNDIYGGGLTLDGGNDNLISDNYIHDNDGSGWGSAGIFAIGAGPNRILNNTIFNNSYGIHLYGGSDYNIISGNSITNNTNIGIYLEPIGAAGAYDRNNYNTISENNISNNNVGIGLGYSTGTEIFHNTISMNAYGISSVHLCMTPFTFYPDPNIIYHNDFLDNAVQAGDSYDPEEYYSCERMTLWNAEYPMGGNYWSDLSPVVDDYMADAQRVPGPDGLNDVPYNITSYARDQYPLTGPYKTFTPISWAGNTPPVITTADVINATEFQPYYNDYNATDAEYDTLVWSLTILASPTTSPFYWLYIDPATGALYGTPFDFHIGVWTVNVSVSDGNGGLDWHVFSLTVQNVNDPPGIGPIFNTEVTANEPYYNVCYASDPDNAFDPDHDLLTWSLDTNASWLSIDPATGVLSGTPTLSDIGSYWVNVSVSDGNGGVGWSEFTLVVSGFANTRYVGCGGTGSYSTIQAAVDAASDGDTVHVCAGYYPENVIVKKSLSLVGMPGASLDGINIDSGDYVNVTGFEMDQFDMGTPLSTRAVITGNTIGSGGMYIIMGQYTIIRGNDVSGGIFLDGGGYIEISGNDLHDNSGGGMMASGIWSMGADHTAIFNNTIYNNTNGIYMYGDTDYNIISGNSITNNTDAGIAMQEVGFAGEYTGNDHNTISENDISNNDIGIALGYSYGNEVFHNTLSLNTYGIGSGYMCMNPFYNMGGPKNLIYHNDFLDNTVQATDSYDPDEYYGCERMTLWDLGYPEGGNYWSDLSPAADENRGEAQHIPGPDGLNDVPYNITSYTRDPYPLTEPFRTFTPIHWEPIPTKELWLQVEQAGIIPFYDPPIALDYQNLSAEAFEATPQELDAGPCLAPFPDCDSQIGYDPLFGGISWVTAPFESVVNTAGVWNFTIFAWTEGEVQGKLFAKVYRYREDATKELLFTTETADSDVQTFVRSFFWHHNAPEIIIHKGERILLEIWVHVRDAQGGVVMGYDHAFYPSSIHIPMDELIFLEPGVNYFSIPTVQDNTSIEAVLSSISGKYDKVMWHDPTDPGRKWKEYTTYKPERMNDLTDIDHTMGLYINIIDPEGTIFVPSGTNPTDANNDIQLYADWNLVGFPSITERERDDGLNNLAVGMDIKMVLWYDLATGHWVEMTASDHFRVGEAYWMYANQDCVWDVPA